MSSIQFYNDEACLDPVGLGNSTGTPDGLCTQFTEQGWRSFRVVTLERTCAVTIYGADVAYCSSTTIGVANFGACMTNTTINQFSVDCQDYSIATSEPPASYVSTASRTATPAPATSAADSQASSSSEGLSGGAKAGIGIGAAVGVLILVGLIVFFVIRNNRRKRAAEKGAIVEADDNHADGPPPHYEMPQEHEQKKALMAELPQRQSMIPVEAPGDTQWRDVQELDGDIAAGRSKASASEYADEHATTTISSPTINTISSPTITDSAISSERKG